MEAAIQAAQPCAEWAQDRGDDIVADSMRFGEELPLDYGECLPDHLRTIQKVVTSSASGEGEETERLERDLGQLEAAISHLERSIPSADGGGRLRNLFLELRSRFTHSIIPILEMGERRGLASPVSEIREEAARGFVRFQETLSRACSARRVAERAALPAGAKIELSS
ncbi:MAG: hypothetical protein AAF191_07345 [Verrucomicrobiota bacterium]